MSLNLQFTALNAFKPAAFSGSKMNTQSLLQCMLLLTFGPDFGVSIADYTMLTGNVVSLVLGGLICLVWVPYLAGEL